MDVDEFINIKIGDGTLGALYAAIGDANMVSLTWRLFGNADVQGYEDRFLIDQFTACAPEVVRKPHQAWGFKTLFRNIDIYKKLGVHRPKGLKPELWDQVNWLNGSGRPMPRELFRNGWRSSLSTYGYDWVQLNHYAVRSAESFLVKRDRGRVNHVDRDQGLNYWFRMNFNALQDRSIQRMIPAARAEFDRLMADPDIAAAHHAAVAAHRAKIADLRMTFRVSRFCRRARGHPTRSALAQPATGFLFHGQGGCSRSRS
jgi:predicted ester cyclase